MLSVSSLLYNPYQQAEWARPGGLPDKVMLFLHLKWSASHLAIIFCLLTDAATDPAGHVGGPRAAGWARRVTKTDSVLSYEGGTGPTLDTVGPTGGQQTALHYQAYWSVSLSFLLPFFFCLLSSFSFFCTFLPSFLDIFLISRWEWN